ncbi:serine-aspartate repeat-containing protein G-like [Ylistrum balloti]|uniref:serine-aspartate repeat-containing protein G-like n=1 Tax=Ylistrum balloti TaxID=509963 RepID=UPI002905CBC6|nr:serine-aspartate repeat-containing protein G-like [Ylistrum balloti]
MSVAENSPIDTIVGSLDIDDTTFNVVQQDIPFIIGNDHLVRTTRVLDRENTSTYSFTVAVTGKIISNITVNVAISDVNDNPPVFNSSEYVFGLPSGSTPVGSVLATDVDLGENGNISYSFQNSFAANKYFAIDSRSGEITLSGVNIPLYQSSFQLGVLASDNGVPKMNSFCSVYISRVTIKGNYTVSIGTPLKEDVLRSRIPTLEREIGNIVNLTITAKVPTAVHKRATTPQEFGATLQISAMYKNGTRVPANDLQRVVLVHLSDIEALWTQEANAHKDNDNHSSVSEIALIVVAGVMLLGTLIALIVLTVKWRQFKSQEKVLRLNESLTRRSSLYESQEIKVRIDDETSDYNGSLNTQDLETYENGHRPLGETNAFENPVYKRDDFDETKVKAQAINEALLSLNSLSDRLDEEDPLAPKPDYEKTEESGLKNNPDLDEYVNSVWTETPGSTDLNTYDSVDSAKNTNSNPYENIEFDDDFPSTSGFAGLKIDGKMITSSGEGHEDDVFIGEEDNNDARYESENEDIPEDEPDVDYHLKQVRFANRVVNADTNIAEELKPDKSELEKETDKKVASTYDDNDDDDDKVFQINTDSNNESDYDADFQVDNADASIRMDEEINSPLDFLKNDDNNTETLEDSGTFVFGGEETTAL